MAGNPTPVFRDDQNVSKASARSHLPHRVGSVSDVRATNFAGVYRIYVSENRRNYDFIPSDATSPDDGFTVIVGPNGERWKHVDIDGSGGGAFDVVVPNIAARAAYDDEKEGFLVLVESDSGHSNDPWGYAKDSDASGDWTAGFPIRGPAVSDGDKGDIVVSGSGTTWTIDEAALGKVSAEESVASAGTLNLTSTKARVLLTGTTATTTITMGNNQRRRVRVQDGWMCNVSGVLVRWLPPGSIVVFESNGSGNVRVVQRAFTIGNVSHIEAEDPWPSVSYKPSVFAKWSAKPWLDDGWYYANASGNRSYYDSKGIIRYAGVNEPAFDTIYATGERGLQYFGSSTNLCLRSQDFTSSSWGKAGGSAVGDSEIAPDGTLTADVFTEDNAGTHYIVQGSFNYTSGTRYVQSMFVKKKATGSARLVGTLLANDAFGFIGAVFNLDTGAITGVSAGITAGVEALPNGWWRIWVSAVATSTVSGTYGCRFNPSISTTDIFGNYTGDGVSGIIVWGGMVEVGASPSPYIKTDGSQVTRASDVLYRDLSSDVVNQNEMTVHVRGAWRGIAPGKSDVMATLGANNAGFANDVYFVRSSTSIALAPNAAPVNTDSGVSGAFLSAKATARIKANSARAYVNGNPGALDTACVVPVGINRFTLGNAPWAGNGAQINGNLMEAALWSRGLPDAALQTIST